MFYYFQEIVLECCLLENLDYFQNLLPVNIMLCLSDNLYFHYNNEYTNDDNQD